MNYEPKPVLWRENNKSLGKLGEDMAADFLMQKSYKILDRNFQNRWGETDIVAKDENVIVFVEVKTRIGERLGLPEDALNRNKINRMVKNAEAYMSFKIKDFDKYRIDAVCIVLDGDMKLKRINHYENITM